MTTTYYAAGAVHPHPYRTGSRRSRLIRRLHNVIAKAGIEELRNRRVDRVGRGRAVKVDAVGMTAGERRSRRVG